ncbi:SdrD B-like domain-containing protein [Actinosynnema sp. NPDC020468]|uniref:SdrD B-like domain-containing protein n=1 Tax=Actinosynnema sp. NPDC020468 TaxID=3154488 RepID=UPI0033D61548
MKRMVMSAALVALALAGTATAEAAPGAGALRVTTFFDHDSDGVPDAGEPGHTPVDITLKNVVTGATRTTTTVNGGPADVSDLPAGRYRVAAAKPDGLATTSPDTVVVTVRPNRRTDVGFGYRGGEITGSVWLDENVDGVRQPGEPPVEGFSMRLTGSRSSLYATNSDAQGHYRFGDLRADDYRLGTYVSSNRYGFTVGGGDSVVDPATGQSAPITLPVGGSAGPLGIGLKNAVIDTGVGDVSLPASVAVGAEFQATVQLCDTGNVPTVLWGRVEFPQGVTVVSATGSRPTWVDGRTVSLSSFYQSDTPSGACESFTITARADVALTGDVRFEAAADWENGPTGGNNVVVKPLAAS